MADARLVLSGVSTIPWRARPAEQALIGERATPELLARAAEIAVANARPLEHNGYKVPLARNLVRRALTDLAGLNS